MVHKIAESTTICISLGYVVYPLAPRFSHHIRIIGNDLDTNKVDKLNERQIIRSLHYELHYDSSGGGRNQ